MFITGTGTGVGKTLVTGLLAKLFLSQGQRVITQKWVQTGATFPEDITSHDRLTNRQGPVDVARCPYMFPTPSSPHLAASLAGVSIQKEVILGHFYTLKKQYDTVLVEGAGGVLVPYSQEDYLIDIAAQLQLPIVLVASTALGSINQTLLSIEAIRNRKLNLMGVFFTASSPDILPEIHQDTPRIVQTLSGVTVLGVLPYLNDPQGYDFTLFSL